MLKLFLLVLLLSAPSFAENEQYYYPYRQKIGSTQLYNQHTQQTNYDAVIPKQQNTHKNIFLNIALGMNYIFTPNFIFKDGPISTNLPKEHNTHTILPVGAEIELPLSSKFSLGLGANYVFNPLQKSANMNATGNKMFIAKTNYLLQTKLNYYITDNLLTYLTTGMTGITMTLYNEINNQELFTSKINTPFFGIGFAYNTLSHVRFFIESTYSTFKNINSSENIAGMPSGDRAKAISAREYQSIQAKIGVSISFKEL